VRNGEFTAKQIWAEIFLGTFFEIHCSHGKNQVAISDVDRAAVKFLRMESI